MQLFCRSALAVLCLLACSCREDPTYVVVEVNSELGEDLTRADVVIRDEQDREMFDRYSFDPEVAPEYRVPFSFVLEPRGRADQVVVVSASGYGASELLSETKRRVRFKSGQVTRHVLLLSAACRDVPACPSGQACDPEQAACGEISDEPNPRRSDSVRTGTAGRAGSEAEAAGGGGTDGMVSEERELAGAGGRGGQATGNDGAPRRGDTSRAGANAQAHDAGRGGSSAGSVAQREAAGRGGAGAGSGGQAGQAGQGGRPAAGSGGAGGGGGEQGMSGSTDSGELVGSDKANVTSRGQGYVVASNAYGPGPKTQIVRYEGTSFTITKQEDEAPGGVVFVAVYNGIQYTWASEGTVLPLRADKLESLQVSMKTNAGSVQGTYQAVNALWFSAGSEPDPKLPSGGYMEVWHYVQPPHDPAGTKVESGLRLTGVSGAYDVWLGTCYDRPCTTYVRTEPVTSFTGDLMPFLRDAMGRPGSVEASWYLNALYCGFDVAAGGVGLSATEISEHVR